MSRLEIQWPDAAAERVRAARGRLERAGEALRSLSLEARLRTVGRVLALWTAPDSAWRRELATTLGERSDFDARTLAEGLESALRAWSPARFIECCREELAMSTRAHGSLRLVPFEWTAVLAGGSIPMPTLLSGLLPLVLGSPVLLRETSVDPVTPGVLRRSLESCDDRLARALEPIGFDAHDETALGLFLEAPCVVATGSDETIRSVRSRLRTTQRFVAYAHRFSIAVLGPRFADDASQLESVAADLALDVARWDQTGCLSPVVVYLVGIEEQTRQRIARAVAAALDALSERLPRGVVPQEQRAQQAIERSEARMRAASAAAGLVVEGRDSSVVLETDAQPRPAPLHRFLRLLPVESEESLLRALEPFRGQLSNVALAGFASGARRSLQLRLWALGVSRCTTPGRLQTPPVDWPHDGLPLLLPMARFARSDGFPGE